MEDEIVDLTVASEIEILPPEPMFGDIEPTCICCGRSQSFLDEDGCGICEECLAP
ncbi:hypothetical protein SB748_25065 [Rhizobium sp. SIMBA_035]